VRLLEWFSLNKRHPVGGLQDTTGGTAAFIALLVASIGGKRVGRLADNRVCSRGYK
jgi:hypothetical protein